MSQENYKPPILCVDDEASVLDSIERVLRRDFDVTTAKSAEEAKQICTSKIFAIALSDFKMPGENGVEFLRWVRNHQPTAVRAILSGQMDSAEIISAINSAEIHRFILKPWDNEYLRVQMLEAFQTHSHLKESKELRVMAITDPVTQLTNHRYFQEQLLSLFGLAHKESTPLSLIMIDVDHFKSFNDHYGHPEGDRLLLGIGQRILSLAPKKSVVSRYGGEEFAVLLPHLDKNSAFKIAEKVRLLMETQAFTGPYEPHYVTISLGVAEYPSSCNTSKDLVVKADEALYVSKNKGRNQSTII